MDRVWKVVRDVNGLLVSCFTPEPFLQVYEVDVAAECRIGGSLTFNYLDFASKFVEHAYFKQALQVWRCDAEERVGLPISPLLNLQSKSIKAFRRFWETSIPLLSSSWPIDTVAYKCITLRERVV